VLGLQVCTTSLNFDWLFGSILSFHRCNFHSVLAFWVLYCFFAHLALSSLKIVLIQGWKVCGMCTVLIMADAVTRSLCFHPEDFRIPLLTVLQYWRLAFVLKSVISDLVQ
jgi:hypothetical protein